MRERVITKEAAGGQRGNAGGRGVIGNRTMLELVERRGPDVIQRTVTIGSGGGKKTYDQTEEEVVKGKLSLYLGRVRYRNRQRSMLDKLSQWLSDQMPHEARTYEQLAANLFEAVLPVPAQAVPTASLPVYEGDFPVLYGMEEMRICGQWEARIQPMFDRIVEIRETENENYEEELEQLSSACIEAMRGYLEFMDSLLEEGDSEILRIGEDIQKAGDMNEADRLGRAFTARGDSRLDFRYAGTPYFITMAGDFVNGGGLGALKNYRDICNDAIRSIREKQTSGSIEQGDPQKVLAHHVASMLLNTAFVSGVPSVRDLCAVISSAETNRSAHNLMAAAASAANFHILRQGEETFYEFMLRTNAFWGDGGAELSRQADGAEVGIFTWLKHRGVDLEALYRRLLNVRLAKMTL